MTSVPPPLPRRTLMSERFVVDPPQLDLLLKQLRLPTMRTLWAQLQRACRPGGLAGGAPARRAGQPGGHRPRAAALRAAPGRGEAVAGQNARQLRLHPRARGVKGARGSPGERRHLARGGRKRASFRPARNGKEPLGRRSRAQAGRERVPGALPAHGQPSPEAPGGTPGPRPRRTRSGRY